MPPYAVFEKHDFPLVTVTFTNETATEENFTAYLANLERIYDLEQPFAFIFNATHANIPGLKYQKRQADWLKQNDAVIRKYCRGTAYVISNPVIRAVLRGIFAFQPQPVPYTVVSTVPQARRWAKERM